MLIDRLIKSRKKSNVLSQCDVLGSYDFNTTIVSLESREQRHIDILQSYKTEHEEAIKGGTCLSSAAFNSLKSVIPLAVHEYTHFIDSTSTLWGLKYLELMEEGYTADNEKFSVTESDFYKAKKFHDFIRFSRLPKYYTYQTIVTDASRPWLYHESIGNRFCNEGKVSDIPVLFIWFSNQHSHKLVRSPISSISILECSAMAQEIESTMALIDLLDDDAKIVERQLYFDELSSYLYNRELTEYSVCAHFVSSMFKEPDIFLTFKTCSIICRYILNLPDVTYDDILSNYNFNLAFGDSREAIPFIEKIKQGLENREMGFLFYLLCKVIPKESLTNGSEINNLIQGGFNSLGIDIKKVSDISHHDALIIFSRLKDSQITKLQDIAIAGYENLIELKDFDGTILFEKMNLPPVLLGDSNQVDIFSSESNKLKSYDLDGLYNELVEGQLWVEKFVEACA
jgi:hypothetical protein